MLSGGVLLGAKWSWEKAPCSAASAVSKHLFPWREVFLKATYSLKSTSGIEGESLFL